MPNAWGIHWHNGDSGLEAAETALEMGVHNFTVLQDQADWALAMREVSPAGVVHVRYYLPNWRAVDARFWAEQSATDYQRQRTCPLTHRTFTLKDIGARVTLANEQNLPGEGGNWTWDQLKAIYVQMNAWNLASAQEFETRTGRRPDWPAVAQGHSDDQDDSGFVGLDICRSSIEFCDWLHVHNYWEPGRVLALVDAEGNWLRRDRDLELWNGPYRFQLTHDLYPGKTILLSECGQGDTRRADAPEEFVRFFRSLRHFPYVRGATPFIFRDPTHHHMGNDWGQNPAIEQRVTAAVKLDVVVPPDQPEDPTGGQAMIGDVAVLDVRDRYPYLPGMAYAERDPASITTVVMHHTVTRAPTSEADALALLDEINRYHQTPDPPRKPEAFPCIAYHLAIDPAGKVYWVNGLQLVTWHAESANPYSIGVAFLGTFTDSPPTPAAIAAARSLWHGLEKQLGHALTLKGHREVQADTICPGNTWSSVKAQMLAAPQPPSEVPAEWRQWGDSWPTVAGNLLGVASDALEHGRAERDELLAIAGECDKLAARARAAAAAWGSR